MSESNIRQVVERITYPNQFYRIKKTNYSQIRFKSYCFEYLSVVGNLTLGSILRATHFAWAKVNDYDILDLKVLLWHAHGRDASHKLWDATLDTLLGKISYICTCRDPRESIISAYTFKSLHSKYDYPDPVKSQYIYNGLALQSLCDHLEMFTYLSKLGNVYYHRVEFLNAAPERSMREIAEFLGIEYKESLLECMQINHSGRGLEGFDKRSNHIRWYRELKNKKALLLLETIFCFHLKQLNYPDMVVVRSLGNYLRGLVFVFLLPLSLRFQWITIQKGYENATKNRIADRLESGKVQNIAGNYEFRPVVKFIGRWGKFYIYTNKKYIYQSLRLCKLLGLLIISNRTFTTKTLERLVQIKISRVSEGQVSIKEVN